MAGENNSFKTTMESLFKGMDGVVSSKTVVGDAIHIGGTIILPLVDVSFGIGAGAFSGDKKEKGMGGIGGKMSPSAVIVIQDGKTRLVNIKNQDTITKILDMVPDVIDRFTADKEERMTEKEVMISSTLMRKRNNCAEYFFRHRHKIWQELYSEVAA